MLCHHRNRRLLLSLQFLLVKQSLAPWRPLRPSDTLLFRLTASFNLYTFVLSLCCFYRRDYNEKIYLCNPVILPPSFQSMKNRQSTWYAPFSCPSILLLHPIICCCMKCLCSLHVLTMSGHWIGVCRPLVVLFLKTCLRRFLNPDHLGDLDGRSTTRVCVIFKTKLRKPLGLEVKRLQDDTV